MKQNLIDTTFIIPVRIEDNLRLNNIRLVLKYINHHFNTNIIVCESSPKPILKINNQCQYIHIFDNKPEFHRTKILNYLTKQTKTPYIINCDTDVLVHIQSYINAIEYLRKNKLDFIFPYNGYFYNVPIQYHQMIDASMSVDTIDVNKCELINPQSVGGIICMNKESFIKSGMENEYFISWGPEDVERVSRWQKLGMRIGRISRPLYHLKHNIHNNSGITNPFYLNNDKEYKKVDAMNKEELTQYINTWSWLKW